MSSKDGEQGQLLRERHPTEGADGPGNIRSVLVTFPYF